MKKQETDGPRRSGLITVKRSIGLIGPLLARSYPDPGSMETCVGPDKTKITLDEVVGPAYDRTTGETLYVTGVEAVKITHSFIKDNPLEVPLEDVLGSGYGKMAMDEIIKKLCAVENLEGVYLGGMGIGGRIPPEVGDLQSAEVIDLSRNNLIGTIPSAIGRLQNARILDFGENSLVGMIPVAAIEKGMISLEELYLHRNYLLEYGSNLDRLYGLKNLRVVETFGKPWTPGVFKYYSFGGAVPDLDEINEKTDDVDTVARGVSSYPVPRDFGPHLPRG